MQQHVQKQRGKRRGIAVWGGTRPVGGASGDLHMRLVDESSPAVTLSCSLGRRNLTRVSDTVDCFCVELWRGALQKAEKLCFGMLASKVIWYMQPCARLCWCPESRSAATPVCYSLDVCMSSGLCMRAACCTSMLCEYKRWNLV